MLTATDGGNSGPIPEEIRARLHKRFPHSPLWAPAKPLPQSPWEVIRAVLAKGRADRLDDIQLAGAVYTVMASHGLITEGRA
ncbi:hypothetical protein [Methylobacterium pseudosasicola]|uniref:Uncharacterized protein n=1 Tax=Methylobacterium pseudosasicola TaxID=582667 RepID=A0A1I4QN95_9HYPH|nr:hypothetical protein [Methylobacterium pseudosasicola]SFM41143.1 hypothetical protein SAMN05192568_103062 [Methylobacterium pseudosasicola]